MYSVKLLAPFLLSFCANEFLTSDGDYCVVDRPQPQVIKYYEPGKSCYINGTFYSKCENQTN